MISRFRVCVCPAPAWSALLAAALPPSVVAEFGALLKNTSTIPELWVRRRDSTWLSCFRFWKIQLYYTTYTQSRTRTSGTSSSVLSGSDSDTDSDWALLLFLRSFRFPSHSPLLSSQCFALLGFHSCARDVKCTFSCSSFSSRDMYCTVYCTLASPFWWGLLQSRQSSLLPHCRYQTNPSSACTVLCILWLYPYIYEYFSKTNSRAISKFTTALNSDSAWCFNISWLID